MSHEQQAAAKSADGDGVILNGAFFKEQAKDAIRTFFVPLFGVYAAAMGGRFTVRYRSHRRPGRAKGAA